MTTLTIAKAVLEISLVLLVCIGFYHEDKFIKFERKLFKFVKCFIKACVITYNEKHKSVSSKKTITKLSFIKNNSNQKFRNIA